MARLSPKARAMLAVERSKHGCPAHDESIVLSFARQGIDTTGERCQCACACQVTTVSPNGTITRTRTRTVKARCKHWYIVDSWSGTLTNAPANVKIGAQTRYGASRASHHSMRSPWNKEGPLS